MSAPGAQCPGCGDMLGRCACTFASIRARLESDRAEMSDRLAESTRRANDAAALIEILVAAVPRWSDDLEARYAAWSAGIPPIHAKTR